MSPASMCSLRYAVLLLLYVELQLHSNGSCASAEFAHIETDLDVISRVPVMEVACDGRITIDSLAANIQLSTTNKPYLPYYPSLINDNAVVSEQERLYSNAPEYVSFNYHDLYVSFARLVEDTLQTYITNIVLFEIDSTKKGLGVLGVTDNNDQPDKPNKACSVEWDPRKSWLVDNIEITSLTFALLKVTNMMNTEEDELSCRSVGVYHGNTEVILLELPAGNTTLYNINSRVTTLNSRLKSSAHGESGEVGMDNIFPLTIKSSAYNCKVMIAVIASHHGRVTIEKWLPLAIYTLMFMPIIIFWGRSRVHRGTIQGVLMIIVTYIGFLGCCVGLGIEIASWHYPLHPFPFPMTVTIYLCSAILYGLVLMGLLWNHPTGCVATCSGLNMILYSMSLGLLVGYFMRHFLILGCMGIAIIAFTNIAMLIYMAYVSSSLPQSFREHTGASRTGTIVAWLPITALIVPVSYFALQMTWTGLPVNIFESRYENGRVSPSRKMKKWLENINSEDAEQEENRRSDSMMSERVETETESVHPQHHLKSKLAVVKLHTAISNIIMIICHHMCSLALLITACIYHAPFVICLFPYLLIVIFHIAFAAREYSMAWRRWGKGSLLLSLHKAIIAYASQDVANMRRVQRSVSITNSNNGAIAVESPNDTMHSIRSTPFDKSHLTQTETDRSISHMLQSPGHHYQPYQNNSNSLQLSSNRIVPSFRTVQSTITSSTPNNAGDFSTSTSLSAERGKRMREGSARSLLSHDIYLHQRSEGSPVSHRNTSLPNNITQEELLRIREDEYLNRLDGSR